MLGTLDAPLARPLLHADTSAIYAEPGFLLFARDASLFAWPFDARTLRLGGEAVPVFEGVRGDREDNFLAASAAANRLVLAEWSGRRRLVWVDRKGRELGDLGDVGDYTDVRISLDGAQVAVARRDPSHGQNQDTWVLDVARGTSTRITSEPTDEFDPVWFPDGRIAYVSDRAGFYDLFARPSSGGPERILVASEQDKVTPDVSPDGSRMIFAAPEKGRYVRYVLRLSAGAVPVRLGESRFSEQHPAFSPDGRWTAFDSDESGQREVYVQPLAGGAKVQVSVGGGQMPVWNRKGAEIFYVASDGSLMSASLDATAGRMKVATPQPLFDARLGTSGELPWHRHPYDVSVDGERFLLIRRARDSEPDGVAVIDNWTAGLVNRR